MSQPASKAAAAIEPGATRLIEHLPYDTDGGIASRASIGLIVLATDYTIEHEWRQLFAGVDGVALYQSRVHNEDRITPETLRAMEPRLTECARVITPDTPVDVMAYGCTSASMAIGEDRVFERIREAKPGVYVAPRRSLPRSPPSMRSSARRIGVLTPYPGRRQPYRFRLHCRARLRRAGIRFVQFRPRYHGRAHHAAIDRERGARNRPPRRCRRGVRVLHLGAG